RRAGGEANDDPTEETASDAVDNGKENDAERKGRDRRQVPPCANVRPARVALSGLGMRVAGGGFAADPVPSRSVQLACSRSWGRQSCPPRERASRKRGTKAKSPQVGECEGGRPLPRSASCA